MVPTMIKQQKKAPKLRGSAAQVRALVPFGVQAANEYLDGTKETDVAAAAMICHLNACYWALSREEEHWKPLRLLEQPLRITESHCGSFGEY